MKSREHGEIATYNGSYAFIRPDNCGRDVFAHESALPDGRIHCGDRVSFDVAPDPYKPGRMLARNVRFEDEEKPSAQEAAEEERSAAEADYAREEKEGARDVLAAALRRATSDTASDSA
jgi:cold shock CspA family protein